VTRTALSHVTAANERKTERSAMRQQREDRAHQTMITNLVRDAETWCTTQLMTKE